MEKFYLPIATTLQMKFTMEFAPLKCACISTFHRLLIWLASSYIFGIPRNRKHVEIVAWMTTLLVIEIRHVALIVISPVTATAIVLNHHYVHYANQYQPFGCPSFCALRKRRKPSITAARSAEIAAKMAIRKIAESRSEESKIAGRVTAMRTDGTSHATDPPEDLGTLTTMMDRLMFLIDVSTAINTMFQNE